MALNTGVSRRSRKSKKTAGPKKKVSRKAKTSKKPSRKLVLPRTAKLLSRRSKTAAKHQFSRASESMSITDLQFLAKSRGVPFGGLTKTKLVKKINNYY